ncbi:phosphopantetheine-binding protein [Streptomyces sp. NBC_01410]|uniref:phosphopantetheine-binding protein n=1 Tax=Streptomyces sp. NBC_01410 TaxID=2903856 RepID=UPI00324EF40B
MSNPRLQIREFFTSRANGMELGDDQDIFDTGYVTSMFALHALTWVEKTFDLDIASEDLMIDNFRTINALVSFVERKEYLAAADVAQV